MNAMLRYTSLPGMLQVKGLLCGNFLTLKKIAMRRFVLSLLAVFLAISFCRAQVPSMTPGNGVLPAIFNSAGGTYNDAASYYRYEWSFGESIVIHSFAPPDSSILVTHGVLQPCTDDILKPVLTTVFEDHDYRLFPNPTAGRFELNFFVRSAGQMSLRLIDATGRLLEQRSYQYDGCCRIELFDLTKYPSGVYYVVAELKPAIDGGGTGNTRRSGLKVLKITN
jgi:hypothetical protein